MTARHPLFVGLVGAVAVSLASAAVALAAETPFKGTVNAVETGTVVFPTRFLDREGTGNATQLGKYTEHVTMVINIPTLSSMGAATFTAANGDTLRATVAGQATRTSPTTLSIVEVYTITAERDASPTQPTASRWKAHSIRRRAPVPASSTEHRPLAA